ncbi:MAG: hypothetical protein O3B31_02855 [Chloroflexi bacterium]|nr:hypothetical protein [Chloroflexota bacterium]
MIERLVLPQRAAAGERTVDRVRTGALDAVHDARKCPRFDRRNQQMHVIRHHDIGVDLVLRSETEQDRLFDEQGDAG